MPDSTDTHTEVHYGKLFGIVGAHVFAEKGWCPNHDRPCPWGCEMECYLQDSEWSEPEKPAEDT
jgi:hypothetical protein